MSDKIQKISDAIWQGAKANEQCFGTLCDEHGNTCALGSALVGIGFRFGVGNVDEHGLGEEHLRARWPNLYKPLELVCPAQPCYCDASGGASKMPWSRNLAWLITHLNDHHQWPREQIASWLFERGL